MALTDEQLEILGNTLYPLMNYLESEVIIDIARRIKKTMSYTRTAELKAIAMRELGYSPAKIRNEALKILNADAEYKKVVAENTLAHKKRVKELLQGIEKELYDTNSQIISSAGNMAWANDLAVWKDAGKKLTDDSYLPKLVEAFAEQTEGELKNLTQTTGFKTMSGYEALESAYRKELDKAVIKVCSGTFSKEKVVSDTVHSLSHSGLRSIDFASGYSMNLDTAVQLAVRTGCHQIAAKVTDKNIENTGENLVYVSKHWGARNKGTGHANHEQWQGKVYFIKDGTDYTEEAKRIGQDHIMSLYYATGYSVDGTQANDPLGLHGYNCRHNHYAWFEGASTIPEEQPEPRPVIINGKSYDYYAITQKMRAMERNIRALKREREALNVLGMDTKEISIKIKRKTQEYLDFCENCKIKDKSERIRYECKSSDLKKTKAWKKYKTSVFENELKAKTLGAADKVGDGSEPIHIGQIDADKIEDAVNYFGEQIRNSDIEHLYVIDKAGNVYYNKGTQDTVSVGTIDLKDCIVLHNHPKSNGIVSFGQDDFLLMRDFQNASYRLVNEKFDYRVDIIKPIDNVTANQLYHGAVSLINTSDYADLEMQHLAMEYLKKEGYIEYVRKKALGRTREKDSGN